MTLERIVVFGPDGQVGRAWQAILGNRAIAVGQGEADFTHPETLGAVLGKYRPDAVVNCAAYTAVDQAEKDADVAQLVNADAPGAIARWCVAHDVPFVHYSTDYVFDGHGSELWSEDKPTGPLSVYGRTKLDGERQVAEAGGRYLIFRTSWVYDADGKNFVNTMLRLGAEREELNVVADQHGAPTYAPHLAEATWQALQEALSIARQEAEPALSTPHGMAGSAIPEANKYFPAGIYHACNAGETTWHGFALCIFEMASKYGLPVKVNTVKAIPSSAYPTPAVRPTNSRMSCAKLARTFNVRLPDWREGLKACLEAKVA